MLGFTIFFIAYQSLPFESLAFVVVLSPPWGTLYSEALLITAGVTAVVISLFEFARHYIGIRSFSRRSTIVVRGLIGILIVGNILKHVFFREFWVNFTYQLH